MDEHLLFHKSSFDAFCVFHKSNPETVRGNSDPRPLQPEEEVGGKSKTFLLFPVPGDTGEQEAIKQNISIIHFFYFMSFIF